MVFQTSPSPSPADIPATAGTSQVNDVVWWVLVFGILALLLLVAVQFHRNWGRSKGKIFTPTFGRVFGLTVIATLAGALTVSTVEAADKSGAFALFGTIAGYLAAGAGTAKRPSDDPPGAGGTSGSQGSPTDGTPTPPTDGTPAPPTDGTAGPLTGGSDDAVAEAEDLPDSDELTDSL